MISDNAQTYGTISRLLHWVMATCFLFMLGTAIAFNIDQSYYSLMPYHKSVGFILLVLAVIRVIWAIIHAKQRPQNTILVKLGHFALYALMITVPLLAVLREYGAAKRNLMVFGIKVMPTAPNQIQSLVEIGNTFHSKLGFLLFALAFGHIIMAIIHQIRGEKIINRMAGRP